jgi:hypothetical protein
MTKYRVIRDVTPEECRWLDRVVKAGEIVQRFDCPTYGCIGPGIAVTEGPGKPFFEIPRDAIEEIPPRKETLKLQ